MKTGRKRGPTARGDVHHPVHSASHGFTRMLSVIMQIYNDLANVPRCSIFNGGGARDA